MFDTYLTVAGNVVDTPKRRVLDNGSSVTTFRLASTSRRYESDKGEWADRDTLYVRVSCWRQLADNAARSLIKGDPAVVHGRYFCRQYEVEGQKRTAYELEAYSVGHDLTRGTTTFHPTPRSGDTPPQFEVEGPEPFAVEEEEPIPAA